jgi:hypothetical protein
VKAVRILIVSLAATTVLATLSVVALAAPNAVGLAASPDAGAAEAEYCPPGEKASRQAAVKRYTRQLLPARTRYFKTHRSAKQRRAFVKKQQAQLKALQRLVAACS